MRGFIVDLRIPTMPGPSTPGFHREVFSESQGAGRGADDSRVKAWRGQ